MLSTFYENDKFNSTYHSIKRNQEGYKLAGPYTSNSIILYRTMIKT